MKIHLGIDVSKLHLDIQYLQQSRQIPNTPTALRRWLQSLPPEVFLVCEASGGYESRLLTMAQAAGRPIARVNARQVRDFARAKGRLAQTDQIDAATLVDFADTFRPQPWPVPDPVAQELSALAKHRVHRLRQVTQNRNLAETIADKKLLAVIRKTVAFLQNRPTRCRTSWPKKSGSLRCWPPGSSGSSKSRASAS
jgi:transposase